MSKPFELLEIESAVRRAVLKMNLAVDEQDWDTVRQCLAPDFEMSGFTPPIRGADTLVSIMKEITAQRGGTKSQHVLSNMMFATGPDAAQVSAYQTAYRFRTDELVGPIGKAGSRVTYGLRREADEWKIVSFGIVRLWQEGEPA